MSSDTYRIFIKEEHGMHFTMEILEQEVALVMATFKHVLFGRSIILL